MTLSSTSGWPASAPGAPLAGMRVLDLSQQLPGPYATQLLASLGASVIKVEPPTGDAARHLDPEMFARVNAGKSSITLNLKDVDHREILYGLIADCDVFVEGFRPGVTARLGCDYEVVREMRPAIVYCSISGFGQNGPMARRPTHDISLQAVTGALVPGARIDRIGVPWVDLATGTSAALTITAAYHAGNGGYIDASMLDAAVAWPGVKPAAVTELEPTYGTLITSDGKTMVIAILEDDMWHRLCVALGWSDWQDDPAFAHYGDRQSNAARIRARLDESFAAMRSDELTELAVTHDLPLDLMGEASPEVKEQLASRASTGHPRLMSVPIPAPWQVELAPAPALADPPSVTAQETR
jgi:crotonobetainyl-CoA:carnitine CoA-transferase CaiB-like acyl-CoA transferase